MKKILTLLLFVFTSSNALAEDPSAQIFKKPIPCFVFDELLNHLKSEFGEVITRKLGKLDLYDTEAVLLENEVKGSWTIIEFKDNTGCVLASGRGSKKI